MASGINQQTAEKSLIAEYAALKAHAEKAEAENAAAADHTCQI